MLSVGALCAQDSHALKLFMQGDSLRRVYRFQEAIEVYQQVTTDASDTFLRDKALLNMILCENGLNMLQYSVNLRVLGSHTIPRESFYLYLDADPRSYWAIPTAGKFPEISEAYPAFVSPSNGTILFTGKQAGSNHLDLYSSRQLNDTLWSYPVPMESAINSAGDECYPVLSADGQTLWFASDGHYGMGGFDLYVSHFDEEYETWSQARNMGFPFSSPENDLAFMPAPDGLSALIVSDRGDDKSQLYLYKVGYELNPERHDWRSRPDIALLAQLYSIDLKGSPEPTGVSLDSTRDQDGLSDYTMLVQNAKKIRDEVMAQEKKLAGSREVYARLSLEEDRVALANRIEEEEMILIEVREKYRLAGMAVQKVEMEFLHKGVLPPIEPPPPRKAESEVELVPFIPQKGSLGSLNLFRFAPPIVVEEPLDISFRIGKTALIIPEETPPPYLFYRVQLAVTSAHAHASSLKGISPVFETKQSSGKYLYAAGQFNSYNEASTALSQVKREGFHSALIIAYYQAKSITVVNARKLETTAPKVTYRVLLGNYPQGLPESLMNAINELNTRDLARIAGEGSARYVIGPFASLKEAQDLQSALTDRGFEGIMIETIAP
jgi:hypothetical protein